MSVSVTAYNRSRPFDEQSFDSVLALVVVAILLLGLVMVFSAGVAGSSNQFELKISHMLKHAVHIGIGLGLMAAVMFIKL